MKETILIEMTPTQYKFLTRVDSVTNIRSDFLTSAFYYLHVVYDLVIAGGAVWPDNVDNPDCDGWRWTSCPYIVRPLCHWHSTSHHEGHRLLVVATSHGELQNLLSTLKRLF